jgi:transposase
MDHLLADLEQAERRLKELERVIARRAAGSQVVTLLSSMPGMGGGFTAVSLACRVGRVERFPRARSLANCDSARLFDPSCRAAA